MKKTILLLCAMVASLGMAWGQDTNLCAAEGVTAKIGGTDVANVLNGTGAQPNSYDENGEMNIIVDLGSSKTINGFSITFYSDRWVSEFTLSYSTDGSSFTKIADYNTGISSNTTTTIALGFASQVTARYVKYTSKKSNKNENDQWSEGIKNFQLIQYATGAEVPPAAPEAGVQQAALFAVDGTASAGTTDWANYDLGNATIHSTPLSYGGRMVKLVENAGKLFLFNSSVTTALNGTFVNKGDGGKGYVTLTMDLYSADAQTGNLVIVGDGSEHSVNINMAAGEWTTVRASVKDYTSIGNISIRLNEVSSGVYPNFRIANVYFITTEVEANPFAISVTSNIATITGNVREANVTTINSADAMILDFSGVTSIAEAITITPHNPNALIRVIGTETDGKYNMTTGTEQQFENLTASNKVVINTYIFPIDQLDFIDANGNKFYNGVGGFAAFISTGSTGYKITRSIPAGKYVTTAPAASVTAPEGINVYEFTDYTAGSVTFTKKGNREMAAKTPYVLYNTTASPIDLVVSGTGDLNPTVDAVTVTQNSANFVANLTELTTSGTQYVLTNGNIKKGNGVKVGAYRAYFTNIEASGSSARAIFIDDEGTTKVGVINANGEIETGEFYNLRGQRVQNPTKGLYIVNGKKVFIK